MSYFISNNARVDKDHVIVYIVVAKILYKQTIYKQILCVKS